MIITDLKLLLCLIHFLCGDLKGLGNGVYIAFLLECQNHGTDLKKSAIIVHVTVDLKACRLHISLNSLGRTFIYLFRVIIGSWFLVSLLGRAVVSLAACGVVIVCLKWCIRPNKYALIRPNKYVFTCSLEYLYYFSSYWDKF